MNAMDSNRKMFAAIIVAVLVAAVIIGRILIATAPKAQRQPGERQARLVEVATMAPSDERVKIAAYGQVEASQRINLAAQVAGRVISLSPRFIPGQRVRAGEVLLQIDPADYQVALDNAQAALASAQAALSQERGSQAVARGDFEALKLEVDADERALMLREPQLRAAEANLRSAEAAVAQAKLNLERCSLRAPLDALVLSRTVGVGAQVSGANMALAELAAASPFWVMLLVPVDELRWVELPDAQGAPGSSVELRDVSQPKASPWRGQVIQLLDAVEEQGGARGCWSRSIRNRRLTAARCCSAAMCRHRSLAVSCGRYTVLIRPGWTTIGCGRCAMADCSGCGWKSSTAASPPCWREPSSQTPSRWSAACSTAQWKG